MPIARPNPRLPDERREISESERNIRAPGLSRRPAADHETRRPDDSDDSDRRPAASAHGSACPLRGRWQGAE